MTAILIWLASNPTVLLICGGIVTALVTAIGAFRKGAASERAKQDAREAKARTIADEVDNDIGAMPPDEARKELGKWGR